MPSRPRQTYAELQDQLRRSEWLLHQAQLRLAALEAHTPSDLELREALNYADGLGRDDVPLRILANAVRSLQQEQRIAKRSAVQMRGNDTRGRA